ncbi:Os03g0654200 [Oryza sativa Japonica Group]|uniref:Os03g0654200 protein n=3 Tax=Oryza sativa TaxID=4530 RepID=A0A0P0W146_ORYSJ|nr:Os03g0654200 [Oryza sativa Japonica Group]
MDMSFEMENACFPNTMPSIDCCIFAVHVIDMAILNDLECLCGLKDERSFFDNGLSLQDMADFYSSSICQGQDLINAQVVVDACEGMEQRSKMPSMPPQRLLESRVRVEASPADSPTPPAST